MMELRDMLPADWPRVTEIYAAGIATGMATFEATPPSWAEWDASHLRSPRIVGTVDGQVTSWAALSPVSSRCVYEGVAEVSVYLDPTARGQGHGTALLSELVDRSETIGIWTLQAGIFEANEASLRIHERCGFRRVGIRERLGQLDGDWKDVVLMERRSSIIG